jgi:thioesterase domain-containing protein
MDRRTVLAAGVAGMAAAGLGAVHPAHAAGASGADILSRIRRVLGPTAPEAGIERGDGWVRARFTVADGEAVPFAVDVVAGTGRAPTGVAYLLPGSGMNFAGNFFTPRDHNLAHHFRRLGHLVVGVTPREDLAAPDAITADWGLAAHRRDLRRVVDAVDAALRLPYRLVGHSAGAALALAGAAGDASPRLRQVIVIDTTGPYEGDLAVRAARTRDVLQAQIDAGTYATDPGLKALIARAVADPGGPSAVPRPVDPTTRFTNTGLAHFALIRTSTLPGPANWVYHEGHGAGTYTFGATPAEDRFALTHSPFTVWSEAVAELRSGLVPTALLRDLTAVWAGDEATYRIAWDRIRAEVAWVNMELGRGDHPRGAELIRAAGNPRVSFRVVPGYGHGDPVFSTTADRDVWPLLTP